MWGTKRTEGRGGPCLPAEREPEGGMARRNSDIDVVGRGPAHDIVVDLCRLMRDLTGARSAVAWIYDEPKDVIRPYASSSPGDSAPRGWSRVPLDDIPVLRDVIFEGRPLVVEDAASDDRLPPGLATELDFTSFRCEPLATDGPVGLLVLEPDPGPPSRDARSIMPTLASALSEAWARREAERQRATAELLLDLATSVASEGSPSELLHEACRRLAAHLQVARVCIYLDAPEGGRIIPRMAAYADGRPEPERYRLFRDADITPQMDRALELTEPLALGPEDIDPGWRRAFDIGAALLVPFQKPPSVKGLLTLDHPGPRRFTQDQVRLASAVGVHVAAIVERADFAANQELELRTAEAVTRLLEASSRAASVDEVAEIFGRVVHDALGAESSVACLIDEDGHVRHSLPIDVSDGFVRRLHELLGPLCVTDTNLGRATLLERRPAFVEDASTNELLPPSVRQELGLRAYAAIPLLSPTRPLGMVLCCHTNDDRRWSRRDRHLAERLALEGSLVVENAVLREAERDRAEALSGEVDRLAELDRVRQVFLATVSHELRTPLTVVTGVTRTLIDKWEELDEERRLKFLERLDANATSVQEMVVRLLDVTRLKQGHLEADMCTIDLGVLAERGVRRLEGLFENHELELRVEGLTVVDADPDLLDRVVENLLSNAVRHTPEGTRVRIEVGTEGPAAVLSVSDEGPGIPPEELDRLGELFYRGGGSRTMSRGLGLGLALSREILLLHGSNLEVQSTPGRGTRFAFRLRLQAPGA